MTYRSGDDCCTTHACLAALRRNLPPLTADKYKGQSGRLAVVGGSRDYTGAPFYAAMSYLRAGGDLATVYAFDNAMMPIKAYSPDIVVRPVASFDDAAVRRIDAVVVGPGLGRSEEAVDVVNNVVHMWRAGMVTNVVIDADALWVLAQSPQLCEEIRDTPPGLPPLPPVVLTPNAVELRRLSDGLRVAGDASEMATLMAHWFHGRAIVVAKGAHDIVACSGDVTTSISWPSSRKRVGGQGDILAGLTGTFLSWWSHANVARKERVPAGDGGRWDSASCKQVQAVAAACIVTREATRRAFAVHGRALVASDVLLFIGGVIADVEGGSLDWHETEPCLSAKGQKE